VIAVALPPSTWVALTPLPGAGQDPVFAVAVDPTSDQAVIAGNQHGGLYRSTDGGSRWTAVHTGSAGILTIVFSPFNPTLVLAGTRGTGALVSTNSGVKWTAAGGLDRTSVRAFGFARGLVIAGTDKGVYTSIDGVSWTAAGLAGTSIDAVAVAAVNPPVRLFAGGDSSTAAGLPLFQSTDAGATWTPMAPPISGTIVTRLVAGPLPPNSSVRPLLIGTNSGLFLSSDNGATFTALSGGALLPATDYTQISFTTKHFDRFYSASDGGGGQSGGLWATADAGKHFSFLRPPMPSVTALAVSGDELPILYVVTFRASDHTPMFWAYHDTGGTPIGPVSKQSHAATPARTGPSAASLLDFLRSFFASQTPYVALGVIALAVLALAVVSHFRSRRR
jgi:hypothetical protein